MDSNLASYNMMSMSYNEKFFKFLFLILHIQSGQIMAADEVMEGVDKNVKYTRALRLHLIFLFNLNFPLRQCSFHLSCAELIKWARQHGIDTGSLRPTGPEEPVRLGMFKSTLLFFIPGR